MRINVISKHTHTYVRRVCIKIARQLGKFELKYVKTDIGNRKGFERAETNYKSCQVLSAIRRGYLVV